MIDKKNIITLKKKEMNCFLILSYFDQIIGPRIFYCNGNPILEDVDLGRILEFENKEETFIFVFRNSFTINHIFNIDSEFARGGQELIMVTFMIQDEIENIFNYLKLKTTLLEEFASKLKEIEEFPQILHDHYKYDDFNIVSNRFKEKFVPLYNKYLTFFSQNLVLKDFDNLKHINVQCPICNKKNQVFIPEEIVNNNKTIINILIPKFLICPHSFITHIDKNFKSRGYQSVDFKVDSLESKMELNPQKINVLKIKEEFKLDVLIQALHFCFLRKKLLILIDPKSKYLINLVIDFFEYVFQDSFNIEIIFLLKSEYKKNKSLYENHVILEHKKVKENKSLKFEREIVEKFYDEGDEFSSLNILREKIRNIYILSKRICDFSKRHETQILHQKNLIKYLENSFYFKIKKVFLLFLTNIVKKYFHTDIKWFPEVLAAKVEQMWRFEEREEPKKEILYQ